LPDNDAGDRGPARTRKLGEREGRRSEADRPLWRSPRLVIARRELASLKSEKTIVLALLIQLVVASFSSVLVVGLVSLYDPGASQEFDVDVVVAGTASDDLVAAIETEPGIRAREVGSASEARAAFERSPNVDAIMVANATDDGQVEVVAVAPEESIRTTVIVVKMRDVLETLERDLRDRNAVEGRIEYRPLDVPDRTSASPYFAFTYTVLIPLLMILPAFISGSIAVDSLTEEVQQGTLELLRVAPVTLPDVVDAKILSTASLAPVQAALWLALLSVQGTTIAHPLALVVVVAGLAMVVVAVGVAIALTTPDRRQAQFLYSTGVLVAGVVSLVLPEHPANSMAKLAIGSPTEITWLAVAGYVGVGALAYVAVRAAIERVDVETL